MLFKRFSFIDLGKQLHRQTLEKCQAEKLEAIRTAEEAVKVKAEIDKQEAITQVFKRTQHEHEKAIRKLNRDHRKALLVILLNVSRFGMYIC